MPHTLNAPFFVPLEIDFQTTFYLYYVKNMLKINNLYFSRHTLNDFLYVPLNRIYTVSHYKRNTFQFLISKKKEISWTFI